MEQLDGRRAGRGFVCGVLARSVVFVRGDLMKPRTMKCLCCGKETPVKGNGQKYCPECGYKIRIEKNHERIKERAAMFHNALKAARTSGRAPIKTRIAGVRYIKCERCGKEVAVPIRAGHAKYCPRCSQAAYRESHKRSKERMAEMTAIKITTTCDVCGKEFSYILKGKHRMTCDVCREMEREKAEHPKWFKKKEPKKPVPSIEDLATAAKAKGMSYGQYKAWLYMQEQKKKA